jgi:hypothetical protein
MVQPWAPSKPPSVAGLIKKFCADAENVSTKKRLKKRNCWNFTRKREFNMGERRNKLN